MPGTSRGQVDRAGVEVGGRSAWLADPANLRSIVIISLTEYSSETRDGCLYVRKLMRRGFSPSPA